jgi:tellurite resistance protein TerC
MDVMGMPLWAWIVFYVLVLVMLVADLKMFARKGEHEVSVGEALKMTGLWIGVSLLFCVGIYFFYPVEAHEKATEFLAGYLIEKSLSMDNLFVFLMLFSFFGIDRKYQHEVLFWGIFGALVLRSIFIFAGAAMVERFEWILGLFGLFLIYTGAKMFSHNDEQETDPGNNFIVRLFKRFFPVTNQLYGDKFFVMEANKKGIMRRVATPLSITLPRKPSIEAFCCAIHANSSAVVTMYVRPLGVTAATVPSHGVLYTSFEAYMVDENPRIPVKKTNRKQPKSMRRFLEKVSRFIKL